MHACGNESDLVSDKMNWSTDNDGDGDSSMDKHSSSGGTKPGGAVSPVLKKGPWTPSEDAILEAYIKKHGERNWKSVQKNTGLLRCGKSCRLRWMNHLRPDLKKGAFSKEEENKIIRLHYKMGNKWAQMSAQLPGRTDNEIKNYWNTRIKKCKNILSLLYPADVCQQALDEDQHESSDFGFREKLTNDSLYAPGFTCDKFNSHPQFSDASIKNILGQRFVDFASTFEIPLPPLNRTDNGIFPSANFLANHGFTNDHFPTSRSITGPMKLGLPSIQFAESHPDSWSMYPRTSATQLTNFADVFMNSTSSPTHSSHVAPKSSDQSEELLHEVHPLNYVVKEELYSGSLNPIVGVPCDAVTEPSEIDPCDEYREQDNDFYTLVESGFCAPSLFPSSLGNLQNSELSSAQTLIAGSNELLLPHYQGDASLLQEGFMPNTHYFNDINPSIFEGTDDLCMENIVDTKGHRLPDMS